VLPNVGEVSHRSWLALFVIDVADLDRGAAFWSAALRGTVVQQPYGATTTGQLGDRLLVQAGLTSPQLTPTTAHPVASSSVAGLSFHVSVPPTAQRPTTRRSSFAGVHTYV